MSSAFGGGFLFVNATGSSASDRKASTLARAFVMRNARAAQQRSSEEFEELKDVGWQSRLAVPGGSAKYRNSGSRKRRQDVPRTEVLLDNEISIVRPRRSFIGSCRRCGLRNPLDHRHDDFSPVCKSCRTALARHSAEPGTAVAGKMDPFNSLAVEFDSKNRILISYCQFVPPLNSST